MRQLSLIGARVVSLEVRKLKFTVDSALLGELGEMLIGKPYIALAELVKNSYDADATSVTIDLDAAKDRIALRDNGQGMTLEEFETFWMRVGSVHKRGTRTSRKYKRRLTGSKGIGRLSVQFLSNRFRLETVSDRDISLKLIARINWREAIKAGNLTEATVEFWFERSKEGYKQGTSVILSDLKQPWTEQDIGDIAKGIWQLIPPSHGSAKISEPGKAFEISLRSQEQEVVTAFEEQLRAIEDVWSARVSGVNKNGVVNLSLERPGEETPSRQTFKLTKSALNDGQFEIKIYNLKGRKPRGILVGEAREYFKVFGGIRVYDSGFNIPYYGNTENDWLGIEVEHSHRLATSGLLPSELQVPGGLSFLPTMTRLLGTVNVNTSTEPELNITITRDRLQESDAYEALREMLRWALHYYAQTEGALKLEKLEKEVRAESTKFERIDDVLESYRDEIPKKEYDSIRRDIRDVSRHLESEAERMAAQVSLMGALATAGISTLSYQHELEQQFSFLDDIIEQIGNIRIKDKKMAIRVNLLGKSLAEWLARAKASNDLFSFLSSPKNIDQRKRVLARDMVSDVAWTTRSLVRGVPIQTTRIGSDLLLPHGSVAEWSSVFQNIFTNALNALVDSEKKLIEVSSRSKGKRRTMLIQNTGIPLDLEGSEKLFEPFIRKANISQERQALGYGGTGLGLTIVRMLAYRLGCEVKFTEPEEGFNTAFAITWREENEN